MDLALNSPITPMEPILAREVKDLNDWVYQVKWDGVRILCHIDNNQVWLWNKRLHQRTIQYPELQKAASLLKASSAILDGEAVVIKNQRPSFPAIMSRDNSRSELLIRQQRKSHPVEYMIFDLLYLDGRNLSDMPLLERRSMLEPILSCEPPLYLVENFPIGSTLFDAVKNEKMEGMVAKYGKSRYVPGKGHHAWYKYKTRLECQAVIGGFVRQGKRLKSLLVGLYDEGRLQYAGRVGTGLNESSRSILMEELSKMQVSSSPFAGPITRFRNVVFVRPLITLTIEFAEWTEDLCLRQPVITGFSHRQAEDCQLYNHT